jgi:hypothetical protein
MITVIVPFLHVSGMALYPFVLLKRRDMKQDKVLINHERIHLAQQLELLIVPFYLLYIGNYLINRLKGQDHHTAYMNILFEKEAYQNEQNLNYLEKRKLIAWWYNKTS